MSNSDFGFGVVGNSRKMLFEKDSKIRISIASDKKFILRATVIDTVNGVNKAKLVTHSVSDIDSLLGHIKSILENNIDKLEFDIKTEKRKVLENEIINRHYREEVLVNKRKLK